VTRNEKRKRKKKDDKNKMLFSMGSPSLTIKAERQVHRFEKRLRGKTKKRKNKIKIKTSPPAAGELEILSSTTRYGVGKGKTKIFFWGD